MLSLYTQVLWVVATSDFIVCENKSDMQGEVVIHPPLGVIKLNITCGAANNYFNLPPYFARKGL